MSDVQGDNQSQEPQAPDRPTTSIPHANRACEACRAVKLRCLPGDPSQADPSVCLRCARSGRQCVYLPSRRRKPRKRTDTRVAELEREIRTMRDLINRPRSNARESSSELHSGKSTENSPGSPGITESFSRVPIHTKAAQPASNRDSSSDIHSAGEQELKVEQRLPPIIEPMAISSVCPTETYGLQELNRGTHAVDSKKLIPDVIDQGLLTLERATQLFDRFFTELVPHVPFASMTPPGISLEEMRKSRPLLFLAVLAAGASGSLDDELYFALDEIASRIYAEQVVMKGWRSLELAQSILLSAMFSYPPDRFADTKFYQYIHMAVSLVLCLNLDREQDIFESPDYRGHPRTRAEYLEQLEAKPIIYEIRKTLLSCYLAGSTVAVAMRRPNAARYSDQTIFFMDYLETLRAAPVDSLICQWAKLTRIIEEIALAFRFDEPSFTVSLADTRVQMTVKAFEKAFLDWKRELPPDVPKSMLMTYYAYVLMLHELALHVDHKADGFRPPFFVESVSKKANVSTNLAPAFIDSIIACVDAAHSLLDVALSMDVVELRALPMVYFARMSYTCLVLVKLAISTNTSTSRIGRVIDTKSVKYMDYTNRLILHISNVLRPGKFRPAAKLMATLFKLKAWYTKRYLTIPTIQDRHNSQDRVIIFNTTPSQNDWCEKQVWNPDASNTDAPKEVFLNSDNDEGTEQQNVAPSTDPVQTTSMNNPMNMAYAPPYSSTTQPQTTTFVTSAGLPAVSQALPTSSGGGGDPVPNMAYMNPTRNNNDSNNGGFGMNTAGLSEIDDMVFNFDPRSFNMFGDMDLDMPMTGEDWKIPGMSDAMADQMDFGSMLGGF